MSTVANKKINFSLKSLVVEAVTGVLSDPDYGLKIKPAFAKKLASIKRNSSKGISLVEAKKKYL